MAKLTPLTDAEKRQLLSLLSNNVAMGRFEGLSQYGLKFNRTTFSRKQILKFNADVNYMSEQDMLTLLDENAEGNRQRMREHGRQQNKVIFQMSRARQAYTKAHEFDRFGIGN